MNKLFLTICLIIAAAVSIPTAAATQTAAERAAAADIDPMLQSLAKSIETLPADKSPDWYVKRSRKVFTSHVNPIFDAKYPASAHAPNSEKLDTVGHLLNEYINDSEAYQQSTITLTTGAMAICNYAYLSMFNAYDRLETMMPDKAAKKSLTTFMTILLKFQQSYFDLISARRLLTGGWGTILAVEFPLYQGAIADAATKCLSSDERYISTPVADVNDHGKDPETLFRNLDIDVSDPGSLFEEHGSLAKYKSNCDELPALYQDLERSYSTWLDTLPASVRKGAEASFATMIDELATIARWDED